MRVSSCVYRFGLDVACTGPSPLVLDGMYAAFSPSLPSDWVAWKGINGEWNGMEVDVVDAVPSMAESILENASEIKGNIALVSRGSSHTGLRVTFVEKVKRASEAGAIGVMVVNTARNGKDGNELFEMIAADDGYKSDIPVIMIKASDAVRLRESGCALIRDTGTISSSGLGSALSRRFHME